jgi:hypothetical protein
VLTIDSQIGRMQEVWPELRLCAHDGRAALWRGPLRPLLQTYTVQIAYRTPLVAELLDPCRFQPRVSILTPPLRRRPGDPEGQLPHVYYDPDGNVTLCLLDPEAGDWSLADMLAETTVPWTIEWLAAYEGWRATGKWTASGRHVEAAHHV